MSATVTRLEVDATGRVLHVFHRTRSSAWTHTPESECDTCPGGMAESIDAYNKRLTPRRRKRDDEAAYMREYRARKNAGEDAPRPVGRPKKSVLELRQANAARNRAYRARESRSA